jgi:AcrR family transcriptional regulator
MSRTKGSNAPVGEGRPEGDPNAAADQARRRRLLAASLGVFLRSGYRKTSMDELARAAGLSRQGLYLHFSTKRTLFEACYLNALDDALGAAAAALTDVGAPLERRLVGAFDAWLGPQLGAAAAGAAELAAAADALFAPAVAERETRFVGEVAGALRAAGLSWLYKPAGLGARQLAETLYATARGWKGCPTRAAFGEAMLVATRALCLPLREGGGG